MKTSLFIVLLLLWLQPSYSLAITVNGLYQTTVPVADETATARTSAMQLALQQVLVKLSGNRNIAAVPGVDQIINNSEQLVQQFRYQQTAAKTGVQGETLLQVKFDENALNNEMRNYALPLWGKERPAVLVWMAVDDESGRNIVSLENNAELVELIEAAASARGIPLIFPLMDLEDNARMNVSDLWGDFQQPIVTASERYPSDAIAVGRLSVAGAVGWQAQWTLYNGQQATRWSVENSDNTLLLEEAVNRLADTLAERYAGSGTSGAELFEVTVSNIMTNDDYAYTLTYLQSLQSVTEVMVKTVMPEQVTFEVIGHGGQDSFARAIQLGNVLSPAGPNQQRYIFQGRF